MLLAAGGGELLQTLPEMVSCTKLYIFLLKAAIPLLFFLLVLVLVLLIDAVLLVLHMLPVIKGRVRRPGDSGGDREGMLEFRLKGETHPHQQTLGVKGMRVDSRRLWTEWHIRKQNHRERKMNKIALHITSAVSTRRPKGHPSAVFRYYL